MKNENIGSSVMIEAAKEVVRLMQTPKMFRDFLLECIAYIHMYDYPKGESDCLLEFTKIVEFVYGPWVDGGEKMTDNIAKGLHQIYVWYGAFDFGICLGNFFLAYSQIVRDGGASGDDIDKHINGLASLMKINRAFYNQHQLDRPD